ncbi:MAG: Veg family protein [Clostridia bacterium]|nr:Veg family protein [Clostridia bacterium]
MIKSTISLSQAKEVIKKMQEKSVDVTLNLGRNKFVSFKGVLSGVYPALFTVTPFDTAFKGKTSYSYSEYLCGKVKLNESKTD